VVRQLGYSDELRRRTALTLAPGEMFRSAASSIAFFVDGQGFADPRRVVPSYASRVLMRRGQSFQPAWLYNTWEPFQRRIDEATSAELIGAAGHMGMDIFTIDDGWQAEYGDNRENLKNFPGDLARIRALLEEQRMGLGLWVPLAAISPQAPDYKQHPEWLCRDREGHPKFTETAAGQQAVMCLGSAYREAAARRLLDVIEKYHPRYLKVDLTTVFNAYGEAPGCNASGHFHKSWAESLERICEGLGRGNGPDFKPDSGRQASSGTGRERSAPELADPRSEHARVRQGKGLARRGHPCAEGGRQLHHRPHPQSGPGNERERRRTARRRAEETPILDASDLQG